MDIAIEIFFEAESFWINNIGNVCESLGFYVLLSRYLFICLFEIKGFKNCIEIEIDRASVELKVRSLIT